MPYLNDIGLGPAIAGTPIWAKRQPGVFIAARPTSLATPISVSQFDSSSLSFPRRFGLSSCAWGLAFALPSPRELFRRAATTGCSPYARRHARLGFIRDALFGPQPHPKSKAKGGPEAEFGIVSWYLLNLSIWLSAVFLTARSLCVLHIFVAFVTD